MALGFSLGVRGRVHGRLKLARLLEAPESAVADEVRALEADARFARLVGAGVVSLEPYGARFGARRFGAWGLRTSTDGLGDALDAGLVALVRRVGQERFERLFLRGEGGPDAALAAEAGVTAAEARRLRALVDRLYIREELETREAAPAATHSAVAGVELEGGRPVLAFFNREIWKGRYRVDEARLLELRRAASHAEFRRLESHLERLRHLDRRKTTLYRALEELVAAHAEFLATGDPSRRSALTQRELASRVDAAPSVINRLLDGKSLQLPWGLETPLKTLVPSPKTILKDRLFELARARPDAPDERLRSELARLFGARLSRRSIAQYRLELGLGARGRRVAASP